jgi:nucleotide-binding universal stress UspA family protein
VKSINNILVPFNLESPAIWGLKYAIDFSAREKDIIINLLYVGDLADKEDTAHKINIRIADLMKKHPAFRGKINILFKDGDIVDMIVKTQTELNSDLIVMGTAGINQAKNQHTVTSDLVLQSDCPVIVVPSAYEEFVIKKIALVLDTKLIDDSEVLGTLLACARRFNAIVLGLTIYKDENEIKDIPDEEYNEQVLKYYLDKFYTTHAYIESNDLEKGIFGFVEDNEIDLLTILPRNHSKKHEPSEGKLTKLLTLKTRIPLLTID